LAHVTHATLNLLLHDVSLKTTARLRPDCEPDIVFMNADGAVLAAGEMREPMESLSFPILKSMIAAAMSGSEQ
jgi:hypothetical protein